VGGSWELKARDWGVGSGRVWVWVWVRGGVWGVGGGARGAGRGVWGMGRGAWVVGGGDVKSVSVTSRRTLAVNMAEGPVQTPAEGKAARRGGPGGNNTHLVYIPLFGCLEWPSR
jgi:hypothetical protein